MCKIEEEIKRNVGIILIQKMTTLLDMNLIKNFTEFSVIGVNVNSLMNVLTHDALLDEIKKDKENMDIFIEALTSILRLFLLNVSGRKVFFYYSFEIDRYTSEFIPEFRKEQLVTYKDKFINALFNHLISILKRLSDINTIRLVNTEKIEPSVVMYHIANLYKESKTLILSRDYMDFLLLINENVCLFDGLTYFIGGDKFKEHTSNKIPNIDVRLLKYYYSLRGIPRLKLKGVNKMGEKRSIIYLKDNLSKILSGEDTFIPSDNLIIFDYEKHSKIEIVRKWLESKSFIK